MKTVLILGANGRFGQAAAHAFASAGWQVLAQVRRPGVQHWPQRVTEVPLEMADTAALAHRAAAASVLLHAVNPPYTRWRQEALPLLEQGLALAQRLGALFMLPGNVYAYGPTMPALLREDAPAAPSGEKGHIRWAMEQRLQAAAATGQRSVVIRAGDFYGCGQGSWLDLAIIKSIAQGRLVYPGPLDVAHAWAYLPDLAQAFVAVAARPPATAFDIFHFAGHTLTGRQLLDAITQAAAASGLRPAAGFALGSMPWGLIRTVGLVYPLWRELARMRYLWQVPHALCGEKLAAHCPLPPTTPVHAALLQSLADLGLAPDTQQPALA